MEIKVVFVICVFYFGDEWNICDNNKIVLKIGFEG